MVEDRRLRLAYLVDPTALAAREWLAFFAQRGHAVSVIVRRNDDVSGLDGSIEVVRLPEFGGHTIRPLGYLGARRAVRDAVATVAPDVLHAHYLTGYGWMARLSGFHPYVVTLWGSDMYRTLARSRKARWFGWLSLSGADLVTMESHDLARHAVRAGAVAARNAVIQFGVDTAVYSPQAPDPQLRERLRLGGRRVVFSPRTVAPLYDHMTVVRAMADLPADSVLVLTAKGAVPDYLRAVEATAMALGLDGRLRVVPSIPHEEMASYYALADVVVTVPETDSVSVCMLEAMACGKPVVASDLPSPREWLDELSPELVVPAGDSFAVAAALLSVLSWSPAERAGHADRARAMVQARGERETNMFRMESLYRTLAAGARRAA